MSNDICVTLYSLDDLLIMHITYSNIFFSTDNLLHIYNENRQTLFAHFFIYFFVSQNIDTFVYILENYTH